MDRKKRILFVTESHKIASGFGVYANEIIPRINATNKYDIAQLACYSSPEDFEDTDWLIYGNGPMKNEDEYKKQHNEHAIIQWGYLKFEHACLDFKPDIVVTWRDPWMDSYIAESIYLPFFHWVWMPTVDSYPQKTEWLYTFKKCDGLLAYSEYGIKSLSKQTNNRIIPKGCASPAIDPNIFNIIPNKQKHKESFGLEGDSFIVGTVMRNQKRKMYPELMSSFKDFLNQAPKEIAKKSYLYLHTSYPERQGWDITSLIHEYGIGSKILVTYSCQECKHYFPSYYRDALTICDKCGRKSATMPGVSNGIKHSDLVDIYNLMDIYVQYAICEGFGMPQVEAAACGVPIAAINYSAMEDVIKYCNGYPIESSLEKEFETNAYRSKSNNKALTSILLKFLKQTEQEKKQQRLETRKGCITRYTWDNAVKTWINYFDNVELKKLKGKWNSPSLMQKPPNEIPKNIDNEKFVEWIFTKLIQDEEDSYNYKMLSMLRDLNYSASMDFGKLDNFNKNIAFEQSKKIADRRYYFDMLRTGNIKNEPHSFIIEAYKRIKQ